MIKRFWKTGKEKRQEFLDKLKGTTRFKVKKDVAIGTMFMISNKDTGHIDTYFCIADNNWIAWGSTPIKNDQIGRNFTNHELEIYLNDMVQKATKENAIHLVDECCCLSWEKPA